MVWLIDHVPPSPPGNPRVPGIRKKPGISDERRQETSESPACLPYGRLPPLVVYVLAVIGVLIASYVVGDRAANDGSDIFAADKAWWYITLLTIGYMISRGLAKAGSRSSDNDPRTDAHHH